MIFVFTISIYLILFLLVCVGFILHPNYSYKKNNKQQISIIIAARNEEKNIRDCINSIKSQDFPKDLFEIIIVDDASSDATFKIAAELLADSGFNHYIIQNTQHLGKKKSLIEAIAKSNFDLIVCRDADTYTDSNLWLSTIVNYFSVTNKEFVICPVGVAYREGILCELQETEMAILSLFTISSAFYNAPFLSNGANLAFTKKLFYASGGYEEHLHIPSGDDIFFLEKVKQINRSKIGYLKNKEAIVYTFPENDLKSLMHQKVRWASKLFKIPNVINWLSAIIITLANFTWIWAIFYGILNPRNIPLILIFILSKLLIDILLVFLASSFIKVNSGVLKVAFIGTIYPFYASFIAILTSFIKPKWKSS